jgi:hypothetical protein
MRKTLDWRVVEAVWVLTAFPAVVFVVCPVFASPFYAAKGCALLCFAAITCLVWSRGPVPMMVAARSVASDRLLRGAALSLAGWILILMVATIFAGHWTSAWLPLCEIASAFILTAALVRLRPKVATIISVIAATSVVLALCVLAGWRGYDLPRLLIGIAAPGRMRTAATVGNPLFIASLLSSSFWSLAALRQLPLYGRLALQLLLLVSLLATGERTVLAGILAGAFVWLLSSPSTPRRLALEAASFLASAAVIAISVRRLNPRSLSSALAGRVFLWQTSLHHWSWIGAGVGGFYSRYTANLADLAPVMSPSHFRFVAYETQAHNLLVQVIVEAGVLGALCFVAALGAWFCFAWKSRERIEVRAAMAGVAAFLGASLFDNPLSRPEGLLLLCLWIAVPMLHRMQVREVATRTSSQNHPLRASWLTIAMTSCGLALMVAATTQAISSYATFAGERAEKRAQWQLAESRLRLAIRLDPAAQDARFDLVRVLAKSGQMTDAWNESELALRYLNEAELHLLRVRILQALGRDSAAQQELALSRRQFPWSIDLLAEQITTAANISSTSP